MSDKPISATELLAKVRTMINDDIESDTQLLIGKLANAQYEEPEIRLTLEGATALAAKIDAMQDILNDLRNAFKHADLQCWSDDEVSPQA